MTSDRRHPLLLVTFALLLAGCSGSQTSDGASAQSITVVIQPAMAQVLPGSVLTFTAEVYGTAEDRATWFVNEPDGGTIDEAGRYTAPPTPGVYHVVASSLAHADARAAATITVAAAALGAPAAPPGYSWTFDQWVQRFRAQWVSDDADYMSLAASGQPNSTTGFYFLGTGIDAAVLAYKAGIPPPAGQGSDPAWYVGRAITYTETLIGTAVTQSDGYRGWNAASPIYESAVFRHVGKLLRVIRFTPALWNDGTGTYADHYRSIRSWMAVNVFQKWWNWTGWGNAQNALFGNSTSMDSTWALIAWELWLLPESTAEGTTWHSRLQQTWQRTIDGIGATAKTAGGVKATIFPNQKDPTALNVWNYWGPVQTSGVDGDMSGGKDTNHAQILLATVLEMYETQPASGLGSNEWTADDIRGWCNTLARVLWNPSGAEKVWRVLNGTNGNGNPYIQPVTLWHLGDGFAKFGAYDPRVQGILEQLATSGASRWRSSAYYAAGALNVKRLAGQ